MNNQSLQIATVSCQRWLNVSCVSQHFQLICYYACTNSQVYGSRTYQSVLTMLHNH